MNETTDTEEQAQPRSGRGRWIAGTAIVIVIVVVVGGGVWLSKRPAASQAGAVSDMQTMTMPMPQDSNTQTSNNDTAAAAAASSSANAPTAATVTYTASGFSPSTVTIAQGGTVTWVNESSNPLYVASDPHPTHTGYDGTTRQEHCAPGYAGPTPFDECGTVQEGGSYSFTFDKAGSWGYHNHMQPSNGGTVVVVTK